LNVIYSPYIGDWADALRLRRAVVPAARDLINHFRIFNAHGSLYEYILFFFSIESSEEMDKARADPLDGCEINPSLFDQSASLEINQQTGTQLRLLHSATGEVR
jgi:hypothetical protein